MIEFDSLNPYQSLEVVIGESPQDLVKLLKEIRTPIKVLAIVPYGNNKQAAYITGDVRLKKTKEKK